jgi:hypothetical protein
MPPANAHDGVREDFAGENTMANAEDDVQKMISGMLASVAKQDMQGLSIDDLKAAMSHPKADATVAELMSYEATSVQPGEAAPDFTLPYLPGSGRDGETMTLSEHFGKRPVALIFGSYT